MPIAWIKNGPFGSCFRPISHPPPSDQSASAPAAGLASQRSQHVAPVAIVGRFSDCHHVECQLPDTAFLYPADVVVALAKGMLDVADLWFSWHKQAEHKSELDYDKPGPLTSCQREDVSSYTCTGFML